MDTAHVAEDGLPADAPDETTVLVVRTVVRRVFTLVMLLYGLAWALTFASSYTWLNLPLALAMVAVFAHVSSGAGAQLLQLGDWWGVQQMQLLLQLLLGGQQAHQAQQVQQQAQQQQQQAQQQQQGAPLPPPPASWRPTKPGGAGQAPPLAAARGQTQDQHTQNHESQSKQRQRPLGRRERDAWRAKVGSKVVEYAWDRFIGAVVQQWVYSSWYSAMTPDREFPIEVRHMLNSAFGELASRASTVDVRALLIRDLSAIVCEHIELYRATVATVGRDRLTSMAPAARERALRREMRVNGSLHTALCTPDGNYHHIRGIAAALLSRTLPGERAQAFLRLRFAGVLTELVAVCVVRPGMMMCLPHSANLQLLACLRPVAPAPVDPTVQRLLHEGMQRFEARCQASVHAEEECTSAGGGSRQRRRARAAAAAGAPGGGGAGTGGVARSAPTGSGGGGGGGAGDVLSRSGSDGGYSSDEWSAAAGDAADGDSGSARARMRRRDRVARQLLKLGGDSMGGEGAAPAGAGARARPLEGQAAAAAAAVAQGAAQAMRQQRGAAAAAAALQPGARASSASGLSGPGSLRVGSAPPQQPQQQQLLPQPPCAVGGAPPPPTATAAAAAPPPPGGVATPHTAAATPSPPVGPLQPSSQGAGPAGAARDGAQGPALGGSGGGSAEPGGRGDADADAAAAAAAVAAAAAEAAAAAAAAAEAAAATEAADAAAVAFAAAAAAAAVGSACAGTRGVPGPLSMGLLAPHMPRPLQSQQQQQKLLLQQQQQQHLSELAQAAAQDRGSGGASGASPQCQAAHAHGPEHPQQAQQQQGQQGFLGYPHAMVVSPEMQNEAGFAGTVRDYVAYKVRVTDGAASWTVTRRFKHFEALHVRLTSESLHYRNLKLAPPPKHIFNLSQDTSFVHQRRGELDAFLRRVLTYPEVALHREVWLFLRPGPDVHYNFSQVPVQAMSAGAHGAPEAWGPSASGGWNTLGDASDDAASAAGSVGGGGGGGGGGDGGSAPGHRRHRSVASSDFGAGGAGDFGGGSGGSGGGAAAAPSFAPSSHEGGAPAACAGAGGASHASAHASALPGDASRGPMPRSSTSGQLTHEHDEWLSQSTGAGAIGEGLDTLPPPPASAPPSLPLPPLPTHGAGPVPPPGPTASGAAASGSASGCGSAAGGGPQWMGGPSTSSGGGMAQQQQQQLGAVQAAAAPQQQAQQQQAQRGGAAGAHSGGIAAAAAAAAQQQYSGASQQQQQQQQARSSNHGPAAAAAAAAAAQQPSRSNGSAAQQPPRGGSSGALGGGSVSGNSSAVAAYPLDDGSGYADRLGVSAPLIEVVDTVFQLRGRGFVVRQIGNALRQALNLLAGDAIDALLLSRLRGFTSELSIARTLLSLHGSLWPGGVWCAWASQQRDERAAAEAHAAQKAKGLAAGSPGGDPATRAAAAAAAAAAAKAHNAPWVPEWEPGPEMSAAMFMEPALLPPDAEQVAAQLLAAMQAAAPGPLVRLLGSRAVAASVTEMHALLQSPTFMLQMGYSVMEAALLHLFPEMEGELQALHNGVDVV
ncbi:hypothetical protein FOA52_014826 [Chlamydomonas sp. UWO 241]|nr:hypothetical protein FOA52_014826 [Chlamydomonas sp. UWO 241]